MTTEEEEGEEKRTLQHITACVSLGKSLLDEHSKTFQMINELIQIKITVLEMREIPQYIEISCS